MDEPVVLVVEDDIGILYLVAEALGGEGYRVATAPDGAAGLAAALADPPALVLTDLLMPGLDGAALCRRLRADPRTRAVPLLVMTALAPPRAAQELADCPHDGLLAKPFELDHLYDAVAAQCPLPVGGPSP